MPSKKRTPERGGSVRHEKKAKAYENVESLANAVSRSIRWLWWPWIPLGKITIIDGEPGVGKSSVTLGIAAAVTRAKKFPETTTKGLPDRRAESHRAITEPASVLLVGIEDDIEDTVVPRLDAAKADRSRVFTMKREVDEDGIPEPFVIPDDLLTLKEAITESGAVLVVIDPIAAFMSESVRPGSDSSNRKPLGALAEIAAETGAAIVLVRHLNKAQGMSAKNRGGGSIAYTGLARSVLLAAKHPDGDFALALTKSNNAEEPDALLYGLFGSRADPDVAVVRWLGSAQMSADELVGADGHDARTDAPDRESAEAVIRHLLSEGPMSAKEVIRLVKQETGVSEKTIIRARQRIGVRSKRVTDAKGSVSEWQWALP